MANVFIAYKREDRERVAHIADALTASGYSVWWDPILEGGAIWRQRLLQELQEAECVLVAWSRLSVSPAGEFVHDEASAAKQRGVYLPVAIDEVAPPLGFGQTHTLPLWDWDGDLKAPQFAQVLAAIERLRSRPASDATVAVPAPRSFTPATSQRPESARGGRAEAPRVAVLGFRVPGGDAEQEHLATGLAEDLIIGLSRTRLLRVLPALGTLDFDPSGLSVGRICTALGADYVVQGQIRRLGPKLRISTHVARGANEAVVWADKRDHAESDLSQVLDEAAVALAGGVEMALLNHEEALAFALPEETLGAWDLLLRGRAFFWRGREGDAAVARDYLCRVGGHGSSTSSALSLLAYATLHDLWLGVERDPLGAVMRAHGLAAEAVRADGGDAFAHSTLGIALAMAGRRPEALAEQEYALRLNPALASALGERARLLCHLGRAEESVADADRALALCPDDPHAWLWHATKAMAHFQRHRFEEALTYATSACVRRSDYYFLHEARAACAAAAGEMDQAHAALREARRLRPVGRTEAAVRTTAPLPTAADIDRYIAALRAAGWVAASS